MKKAMLITAIVLLLIVYLGAAFTVQRTVGTKIDQLNEKITVTAARKEQLARQEIDLRQTQASLQAAVANKQEIEAAIASEKARQAELRQQLLAVEAQDQATRDAALKEAQRLATEQAAQMAAQQQAAAQLAAQQARQAEIAAKQQAPKVTRAS